LTTHSKFKRQVSKNEMPLRKNILPDGIYVVCDTTLYNRLSIIHISA
jgi:hypothetical protein